MSFNRIISAAERAKPQFSPVHGSPEDNCAVLKEMALDMLRALHGLVEEAGGDPDIITTWIEGVPSDLDYAFRDEIERWSETPAFLPSPAASLERCFSTQAAE